MQSTFRAAIQFAGFMLATSPAHALLITPNFDSSITGNANALQIENSINSAIGTLNSLYSNPTTISVNFSYKAASAGNLLSTTQYYYDVSYGSYVNALRNIANNNPRNTVLATALGNLGQGNDANGSRDIAVASGLYGMLGLGTPATPAPSININSSQPFSFGQSTGSTQYDLIGGLEHELDEVLGGGGAGSTLNGVYYGNAFFASKFGPLDLYRYQAPGTPSFTTSSGASSYYSIDGGRTPIVAFNQSPNGDFGDFGQNCFATGSNQLIQDAFACKGPMELYTANSPEYTMLESIGWNPFASSVSPVPLPSSDLLFAPGLAVLAISLKRSGRRSTTSASSARTA